MKQIILATESPRRIELAKNMGLEFRVVPSRYKEDMALEMAHTELVKHLAFGKAMDVAEREQGYVIGVDTFMVCKGRRLGKPKCDMDAYLMLRDISNSKVEVYSGISIIDTEQNLESSEYVKSYVSFKKMSQSEIDGYIKSGEPLDKAGGIGIQGMGSIFVDKIYGSYSNIVGFPQEKVYEMLKCMGVDLLEKHKGSIGKCGF